MSNMRPYTLHGKFYKKIIECHSTFFDVNILGLVHSFVKQLLLRVI